METGPLFLKFNETDKKIIVCQGGGDAGKTSDILKWITVECLKVPKTRATITGEDLPNLKRGVVRLLKDYVLSDPEVKPHVKKTLKEDTYIEFSNGSFIDITGFDNEQDARGSERDLLYINECNSRTYNLFWQLQRKTRRRIFLDYNPTHKFWVQHKLLDKKKEKMFVGEVQLFITDHRHNPFLSQEDHDSYESISDPELFQVYSRGMMGKLKGRIYDFKKVDKVPLIKVINEKGELVEKEMPFGFGIDIGYTVDQSAIVKVWYDGRKRYYKELLYKSENEILEEIQEKDLKISVYQYFAKILKDNGCTTATLVWGDHDKTYSTGLRRLGIAYRMARKGPNSVTPGISKVRQCENYYIDSPNIEREQETYVWDTAVDILTGEEITTNQPVDGMPDHTLAAIRYFCYSYGMRFTDKDDE